MTNTNDAAALNDIENDTYASSWPILTTTSGRIRKCSVYYITPGIFLVMVIFGFIAFWGSDVTITESSNNRNLLMQQSPTAKPVLSPQWRWKDPLTDKWNLFTEQAQRILEQAHHDQQGAIGKPMEVTGVPVVWDGQQNLGTVNFNWMKLSLDNRRDFVSKMGNVERLLIPQPPRAVSPTPGRSSSSSALPQAPQRTTDVQWEKLVLGSWIPFLPAHQQMIEAAHSGRQPSCRLHGHGIIIFDEMQFTPQAGGDAQEVRREPRQPKQIHKRSTSPVSPRLTTADSTKIASSSSLSPQSTSQLIPEWRWYDGSQMVVFPPATQQNIEDAYQQQEQHVEVPVDWECDWEGKPNEGTIDLRGMKLTLSLSGNYRRFGTKRVERTLIQPPAGSPTRESQQQAQNTFASPLRPLPQQPQSPHTPLRQQQQPGSATRAETRPLSTSGHQQASVHAPAVQKEATQWSWVDFRGLWTAFPSDSQQQIEQAHVKGDPRFRVTVEYAGQPCPGFIHFHAMTFTPDAAAIACGASKAVKRNPPAAHPAHSATSAQPQPSSPTRVSQQQAQKTPGSPTRPLSQHSRTAPLQQQQQQQQPAAKPPQTPQPPQPPSPLAQPSPVPPVQQPVPPGGQTRVTEEPQWQVSTDRVGSGWTPFPPSAHRTIEEAYQNFINQKGSDSVSLPSGTIDFLSMTYTHTNIQKVGGQQKVRRAMIAQQPAAKPPQAPQPPQPPSPLAQPSPVPPVQQPVSPGGQTRVPVWKWMDDHGGLFPFPAAIQATIEQAKVKGHTSIQIHGMNAGIIDFTTYLFTPAGGGINKHVIQDQELVQQTPQHAHVPTHHTAYPPLPPHQPFVPAGAGGAAGGGGGGGGGAAAAAVPQDYWNSLHVENARSAHEYSPMISHWKSLDPSVVMTQAFAKTLENAYRCRRPGVELSSSTMIGSVDFTSMKWTFKLQGVPGATRQTVHISREISLVSTPQQPPEWYTWQYEHATGEWYNYEETDQRAMEAIYVSCRGGSRVNSYTIPELSSFNKVRVVIDFVNEAEYVEAEDEFRCSHEIGDPLQPQGAAHAAAPAAPGQLPASRPRRVKVRRHPIVPPTYPYSFVWQGYSGHQWCTYKYTGHGDDNTMEIIEKAFIDNKPNVEIRRDGRRYEIQFNASGDGRRPTFFEVNHFNNRVNMVRRIGASWAMEDDKGGWYLYKSQVIEQQFQDPSTKDVLYTAPHNSKQFTVTFNRYNGEHEQSSQHSSNKRHVMRFPGTLLCDNGADKFPGFWNPQYVNSPERYSVPVLLKLASDEPLFQQVKERFHESVKERYATIIDIHGVQNQYLNEKYLNAKKYLILAVGAKNVRETTLFHGTGSSDSEFKALVQILTQGPRKEFSTQAAYGEGTYTARKAEYAVFRHAHAWQEPKYIPKNRDGVFRLLVCQVILGEKGVDGKVEHVLTNWPLKQNGPLKGQIVDNLIAQYDAFVIHNDGHVLPRFVISFKLNPGEWKTL